VVVFKCESCVGRATRLSEKERAFATYPYLGFFKFGCCGWVHACAAGGRSQGRHWIRPVQDAAILQLKWNVLHQVVLCALPHCCMIPHPALKTIIGHQLGHHRQTRNLILKSLPGSMVGATLLRIGSSKSLPLVGELKMKGNACHGFDVVTISSPRGPRKAARLARITRLKPHWWPVRYSRNPARYFREVPLLRHTAKAMCYRTVTKKRSRVAKYLSKGCINIKVQPSLHQI
jgi:hypothetical protein